MKEKDENIFYAPYIPLEEKEMKEERKLAKFIFEHHNMLGCIVRFNRIPRITSETVADHSYYVAFMAMLVGDYLADKGVKVDKDKLIRMALLHDVEETISGDIVKRTKFGKFKVELDKANEVNMQFLMSGLEKQGQLYYDLWLEAKGKKSLEAIILDFVDGAAVLTYCTREMRLGNRYFKSIFDWVLRFMTKFVEKIPELEEFVQEIVDYASYYLKDESLREER